MNHTKLTLSLAFGTAFFLMALQAAQVSFSTLPPTPGRSDIANLSGADSENDNIRNGDHDATYIANDRPIQGQTFTTGTNSAGYQLRSVTLRAVKHETYALVPDLKYTIRVTKPSADNLQVVASETAWVAAEAPQNFTTISDGAEIGNGSGAFITFTFEKPVTLKPKTTYGFDVGSGQTRHYWQTDGTASNVYTGGEAYSSGASGVGDDKLKLHPGDRVFVVAMVPASAPLASQSTASVEEKDTKQ